MDNYLRAVVFNFLLIFQLLWHFAVWRSDASTNVCCE